MPFESFERSPIDSGQAEGGGIEKIEEYLRKNAQELKKDGFPIADNFRIDMSAFEKKCVYSPETIEEDRQYVIEKKKRFREEEGKKMQLRGQTQPLSQGEKRSGEKLELFVTAVLQKHLGKRFCVARTCDYDDIARGVDNLIIDKKTGAILCSFDEVAEISGPRYEKKRARVSERNLTQKGANLKYGVSIEVGESGSTVNLGSVKNVPVFYLAFPRDELEKAIKKFNQDEDYEKKVFDWFIRSIQSQLAALRLKELKLSPDFKKRLNAILELELG